jgi:hypothetical protein
MSVIVLAIISTLVAPVLTQSCRAPITLASPSSSPSHTAPTAIQTLSTSPTTHLWILDHSSSQFTYLLSSGALVTSSSPLTSLPLRAATQLQMPSSLQRAVLLVTSSTIQIHHIVTSELIQTVAHTIPTLQHFERAIQAHFIPSAHKVVITAPNHVVFYSISLNTVHANTYTTSAPADYAVAWFAHRTMPKVFYMSTASPARYFAPNLVASNYTVTDLTSAQCATSTVVCMSADQHPSRDIVVIF